MYQYCRQLLKVFVSTISLMTALLAVACAVSVDSTRQTAIETAHKAEEHGGKLPELAAVALPNGVQLQVVATTSIVADIVAQVGGDAIALTQLFPLGADAHSYETTPQDIVTLSNAHVIFINGLGLEKALTQNLGNIGGVPVLAVNTGIETLAPAGDHMHEAGDPHTWFSIHIVEAWVDNIDHALSELDPTNAAVYAMNAAAYRAELETLAIELDDLVATLPVDERKLVTDHAAVGYLAVAYDFTIIGAVTPSFSTMAVPSAQELAFLQKQIEIEGVSAIFVSVSANADLSTQIAQDLGVQVVPIYVESLSAADGPTADYIAFMRHTLTTIVEALAP